jgi:hypothetical protein
MEGYYSRVREYQNVPILGRTLVNVAGPGLLRQKALLLLAFVLAFALAFVLAFASQSGHHPCLRTLSRTLGPETVQTCSAGPSLHLIRATAEFDAWLCFVRVAVEVLRTVDSVGLSG